MTSRLALATRTMRARKNTMCLICQTQITVGSSIARLTEPPEWVHTRCVPAVRAITERLTSHVSGS